MAKNHNKILINGIVCNVKKYENAVSFSLCFMDGKDQATGKFKNSFVNCRAFGEGVNNFPVEKSIVTVDGWLSTEDYTTKDGRKVHTLMVKTKNPVKVTQDEEKRGFETELAPNGAQRFDDSVPF